MLKFASCIWIGISLFIFLVGNSNGVQFDRDCKECKWISIGSTSNETAKFMVGPPTIFENATVIKETIERTTEGRSAPTTPSEILAVHNAYRAEVGMPPLVWSATLASYAQNWANYLVANNLFQHSGGPYGENLARGWPSGYWSDTSLVNLWGDEKQYFKCGIFPDVSTTGDVVGHYTQMIWPTTTELGCGVASSDIYGKCLVCEYNPPGNWIGVHICPADRIGVFRNGGLYFDANGDRVWSTGDTTGWFGTAGDLPIAGDWDGNGRDEIGVFRNGGLYFDANGDRVWSTGDTPGWFGIAGDLPVAGDWDGNGRDEIAVFRNGGWFFDANGDGYWSTGDITGWFGATGDLPVAGDWNGDDRDEIAVFRNGGLYFDANGDRVWSTGDTTGWFGTAGDLPVAGDWDGDGRDEIGVFRNGGLYFDANGDRVWSIGDTTGWFGASGDKPFAGRWS
jgi:hypothetical protein